MRRITGAAALGYVVLAAIENMGLLGAPRLGASAAEVRSAYADQALGAVTTTAGALSLVAYAVFAIGLLRLTGAGAGWLVPAIAGPALAGVGVVAAALLVAGGGDDPALHELQLQLRYAVGPLMALVLLRVGTRVQPQRLVALGAVSGIRPAVLRRLAPLIAVPLALTPLALTGEPALQLGAALAFGAHSLWILLAGLWLTVGGPGLVRRAAFLMLVLAAGLVGLALLAVPEATGSFFAWGLKPAELAAFAGGVYVGSAAVYAAGLRARDSYGLVVAAVVLSVSVLTATIAHFDVFDFDRLQAWAWLALFAAFGATTTGLALLGPPERGPGPALPSWTRALLAVVAASLGGLGAALWIVPGGFDLPPLGGRFAGSWIVMLAVLVGWAAARNRRDEARLPALALIALPAGALVAAMRTTPVFGAGSIAALALLIAAGALVWYVSAAPDGAARTARVARTPAPPRLRARPNLRPRARTRP